MPLPKELAEALDKQNIILEAIATSTDDSASHAKEYTGQNSSVQKKIERGIQDALGVNRHNVFVTGGIKAVNTAIRDAVQSTDKMQKAGLAQGISVNSMISKWGPSIDGLSGNLTGYTEAIDANFSVWSAGLRKNTPQLTKLALATKLTSGQHKPLMKAMAKNLASQGASKKAIDDLAGTTLGLSQNFGITTNTLVESIGSLKKEMNNFAILGVGVEIQEASMRLAAAFDNPEMANLAPEIVKALTSGSSMVLQELAGVSEHTNALLSGTGDANKHLFDAVIAGGKELEKQFGNFTDGAGHIGYALDAATSIYGEEGKAMVLGYKQLKAMADQQTGGNLQAYRDKFIKEQEANEAFAKTFKNFKATVLAPLMSQLVKIAAWLQQNVLGNKLAIFIGKAIVWVGSIILALGAFGAIVSGFGKIVALAAAPFAGLITAVGKLSLMIGKLFPAFITMGGKLLVAGKAKAVAGAAAAAGATAGTGATAGVAGPGMLQRLAKGLRALGSKNAGKGANTLLKLAAALVVLAGSFILFNKVEWESVPKAALAIGILAAAAFQLGKMKRPINEGATAMIVLSGALTITALALNIFNTVEWESVIKGTLTLGALVKSAAMLGTYAPALKSGAIALVALGAALIPAAFAFKLLEKVNVGQMLGFIGAMALVALGASALGAPPVAAAVLLGAAVIALLGASLIPFAFALKLTTEPLVAFSMVIGELANLNFGQLAGLSIALGSLGAAMILLSAGGLISSVLDGLGSLFGADSPIKKMVKLGNAAQHINKLSESIKLIPRHITSMVNAFRSVPMNVFTRVAAGIDIIASALDRLSATQMIKVKLLTALVAAGPVTLSMAAPEGPKNRPGYNNHPGIERAAAAKKKNWHEGFTVNTTGPNPIMGGNITSSQHIPKSIQSVEDVDERIARIRNRHTNRDSDVERELSEMDVRSIELLEKIKDTLTQVLATGVLTNDQGEIRLKQGQQQYDATLMGRKTTMTRSILGDD